MDQVAWIKLIASLEPAHNDDNTLIYLLLPIISAHLYHNVQLVFILCVLLFERRNNKKKQCFQPDGSYFVTIPMARGG